LLEGKRGVEARWRLRQMARGVRGGGGGVWGGGVLLRQHRLVSSDAPSDLGARAGSVGAGSCKASKRGGGVGARGIRARSGKARGRW